MLRYLPECRTELETDHNQNLCLYNCASQLSPEDSLLVSRDEKKILEYK
jgi:hypothetical protein